MVDRSLNTSNHIPFSPLRNSSIGFIDDDYESGMEASASSMAEEEEDEVEEEEDEVEEEEDEVEEEEDEIEEEEKTPKHHQHIPSTKKRNIILPINKLYNTSHRRMSSGNSSTDSNATNTQITTSKRHVIPRSSNEFSSPLQIIQHQNPAANRLSSRKEDVPPTPSSGYDGDTEGPLIEDNN